MHKLNYSNYYCVINFLITAFKYLPPPPSVPDYYICRRHLVDEIAEAICFSSDTFVPGKECVTVTLVGAGGFGKTTMAVCLCYHKHVKEIFTNGAIFIELGPQSCEASKILNECYCQMTGHDFEHKKNVDEKIQEITKIHKNTLVIIDDVWKVEDVKPIVKAFSYCRIIVTTRNPNIGIPSTYTFTIGPMSLRESVSLMISGIKDYIDLSKVEIQAINDLAQSTHQWPLLLSLIRGQLYHSVKKHTFKDAILDVQSNLYSKGLAAFDDVKVTDKAICDIDSPHKTTCNVQEMHKIRQNSVRACIEVSLGLLEKSESDKTLKDKMLSLILYTGIGGSLPSQAVECLWNVPTEIARKTVSLLELYGLVCTKRFKLMPPYYSAAYNFLAVHSVISEYIISTIKSVTVAHLSPFIFLNTNKLIAKVQELLFQKSHEDNRDNKPEFLSCEKQKMEHIVLPYYMKEINMHALHDPHFALLILHNIQALLNDVRYFHLLISFNEEISTLISECHIALSKAQDLSRKVNQHFQLCFRIMRFDNLLPILEEYLETKFISSTIVRCVELTENISTHCDAELKSKITNKRKDFQILTKEYHAIAAEKLPRFKLYVALHKKITIALLDDNTDQIEELWLHITSLKFEDKVQLVHDNYLIMIQDSKFSAKMY